MIGASAALAGGLAFDHVIVGVRRDGNEHPVGVAGDTRAVDTTIADETHVLHTMERLWVTAPRRRFWQDATFAPRSALNAA